MSRRALEIGEHGPASVTFQRKNESGRWVAADEPRRRGRAPKPDERYRARAKHRDTDGVVRDVETYRATKAAAESALREVLARRGRVAEASEIRAETRFSDAVALWEREVKQHAGLSVTSQRVYLLTMSKHVTPKIGALRLLDVTVPRLTALLREVATTSPGSAKTARTVLRSFFELAQRHGAVVGNPVRMVPAISVPKATKAAAASARRTAWSFNRTQRDEILAFADADRRAQGRDLPDLVAFLSGTGVRIGEALAMRWEDLDLDAAQPVAEIGGTVVYVTGSGPVRQDGGKTMASTRSVALAPWLVERLRARRAVAAADSVAVFPSAVAGKLRDPSNTAHHFRDLLDDAGYPWATAHTFRKTAGTLLTDAGVSIREVANQLGHAKVSTTLDYYQGRGTVTRQAADVL